jgi:hypothetical protein
MQVRYQLRQGPSIFHRTGARRQGRGVNTTPAATSVCRVLRLMTARQVANGTVPGTGPPYGDPSL